MFYILLVMGLEPFHSDNCLELSIPVLCNHNYGMQNGVYVHATLRVYTPSSHAAGGVADDGVAAPFVIL